MIKNIVNNKYIILNELGSGKVGVVYRAKLLHDTSWGKKNENVALKKYKSWVLEEPRQVDRIHQELSTGQNLKSDQIVKTYDIVEDQDALFLVMEYLEGETLEVWIENNPNPSFEVIKNYSIEILKGLKEIHKNKLIHRDIKPANIMVTNRGLIIMDLGVIKDKNATTSLTGDKFLGTIKYSAP